MDRRSYPRVFVSCPVNFCVDLLGYQFQVEDFSSSGTVLDISRNGLLAEVDRLVAVGTDCVLTFINADGLVSPLEVRGKVQRTCIGGAGWRIGIKFDGLIDVEPQLTPRSPIPEVRTA